MAKLGTPVSRFVADLLSLGHGKDDGDVAFSLRQLDNAIWAAEGGRRLPPGSPASRKGLARQERLAARRMANPALAARQRARVRRALAGLHEKLFEWWRPAPQGLGGARAFEAHYRAWNFLLRCIGHPVAAPQLHPELSLAINLAANRLHERLDRPQIPGLAGPPPDPAAPPAPASGWEAAARWHSWALAAGHGDDSSRAEHARALVRLVRRHRAPAEPIARAFAAIRRHSLFPEKARAAGQEVAAAAIDAQLSGKALAIFQSLA